MNYLSNLCRLYSYINLHAEWKLNKTANFDPTINFNITQEGVYTYQLYLRENGYFGMCRFSVVYIHRLFFIYTRLVIKIKVMFVRVISPLRVRIALRSRVGVQPGGETP